jgi:uncharacterized protein GlcG (DUF336 family)
MKGQTCNWHTVAIWLATVAPILAATSSAHAQRESRPITLDDAKRVIEAAQRTAGTLNVRVSIAVVDARGDLVAVERLPGAGAASADTTIGKAMVTAIYGRPSGTLTGRATAPTSQGLNDATGNRLRFLQGGVPLIRNGQIIGAVAAGGATSQQDEDIAKSGAAALAN